MASGSYFVDTGFFKNMQRWAQIKDVIADKPLFFILSRSYKGKSYKCREVALEEFKFLLPLKIT